MKHTNISKISTILYCKRKKLTAIVLSVIMILTVFPMSVFAASVGSSADDKSVGEDVMQNAYTAYDEFGEGSANTKAYLTVDDGSVVVGVPTSIILNGSADAQGKYKGDYSVYAKGDIAGNKTLNIYPETDTVSMTQTGKIDKEATIRQSKTLFSSEDIVDGMTTTGDISAEGLTAGSWNGEFNFIINMFERAVYYSSLERAVADANNLTTENADVKRENASEAVAAMYVQNRTAYIRMMNNEDNVQSMTISQNTVIDLNDHAIYFAEDAYITSTQDFTVLNGELIGTNAGYVLYAPMGNDLIVNDTDISLTADSSNISNNFAIYTKVINNSIKNCNITVTNETVKAAGCIIISNASSVNEILDLKLDSFSKSGISRGIQCSGNTTLTNSNIIAKADTNSNANAVYNGTSAVNTIINGGTYSATSNTGTAQALSGVANTNVVVNGGAYSATSNTGSSFALSGAANTNVVVNGGKFTGEVINNKEKGCGIGTLGSITINSTPNNPVSVYGQNWGIEAAKCNINGGTYTSNNHPLYIFDNSQIKNANIYVLDNQGSGYVYIGSPYGNENGIIEFDNCVFGNPNDVKQNGDYCFVSQRNYDYTTVKEVNIKNCDIYKGNSRVFSYHNSFKDGVNLNHTKFNLYGDTKIYKQYDTTTSKWVEYSKSEIADYINPIWKTTINGSNSVGNDFVWSPNSIVTDGVIEMNNLTDDAGVFDYR